MRRSAGSIGSRPSSIDSTISSPVSTNTEPPKLIEQPPQTEQQPQRSTEPPRPISPLQIKPTAVSSPPISATSPTSPPTANGMPEYSANLGGGSTNLAEFASKPVGNSGAAQSKRYIRHTSLNADVDPEKLSLSERVSLYLYFSNTFLKFIVKGAF